MLRRRVSRQRAIVRVPPALRRRVRSGCDFRSAVVVEGQRLRGLCDNSHSTSKDCDQRAYGFHATLLGRTRINAFVSASIRIGLLR
jgi:hypothetical protein